MQSALHRLKQGYGQLISRKRVLSLPKEGGVNGVSEFVIAEVRNCYKTNFPSSMFDIVYGGGVFISLGYCRLKLVKS